MAASRNVGMISWNKRRVLQARANLNGGELDEGLKSDQKRGGKMLRCPRTGLNGGERVQCMEATEQRRMWKTDPGPA